MSGRGKGGKLLVQLPLAKFTVGKLSDGFIEL